MISFPKFGTDRFYLWLKETNLQLPKGYFFLCSLHFNPNEIQPRLLKRAVPSLLLGYVKSPKPKIIRTYSKNKLVSTPQTNKNDSHLSSINSPHDNITDYYTNLPSTSTQPLRTYGKSPFILEAETPSQKKIRIEERDNTNCAELLVTPEKSRRELFIRMRSSSPEAAFCNECIKKEKIVLFWRLKHRQLLKKYVSKTKKASQLKHLAKYKKKVLIITDKELDHLDGDAKVFAKMQMVKRKSTEKWGLDERLLAQSFFYKSPSFYMYLRKIGLYLPSASSISRWLPVKNYTAGFNNEEAILNIRQQLSDIQDDKILYACISFDEMHCRGDLYYNSKHDRIDGVVDNGTIRTPNIGDQVCVFMIRGVFSHWRFVLSFVVSAGSTKKSQLKEHLFSAIDLSTKIGFNVIGVTCDQGTNNQSLYKNELGVTINDPYFVYNKKRIYTFFDAPHLIKSVRNILLKNDLETEDGIVSWKVIEKMYNLDSENATRMCPKLTDDHILHIKHNSFKKNASVLCHASY